MNPQVFLGCVLAVTVAAGVLSVRWLRTQRYRLEDEVDYPRRSHVWVGVVMPLVSVLAALGVVSRWPWWVAIGPVLFVMVWLIAAGIDADTGRLPNVITFPLAGVALAWGLAMAGVFGSWEAALRTVAGGLGLGLVYLLLMGLSLLIPPHRAGLGAGDVKLAVSIGAALGWFSWLGVFASVLLTFGIGAIWALVLMVVRRAGLHDSFSFGPAMALGAGLAFLIA